MTVSKKPRRKSARRSPAKHRAHSSKTHRPTIEPEVLPAPPPPEQVVEAELVPAPPAPETFTQQWWDAWRRANALGWEYLDAASGLFRHNLAALASATRSWPRRT